MPTDDSTLAPAAPERIDLRPLLPTVRDQGQRSTCIAFTATAAHEVARAAGVPVAEDLCEEVLYWGCKQIDGNSSPGTRFGSAAAALKRWGQPLEELWPYDGMRDDTNNLYAPPATAIAGAACCKTELGRTRAAIEEIKRRLTAGKPVALGLEITHGFALTADGTIPLPGPGEPFTDGHAVLVVGYDDARGAGCLIFRNSWGADWGDGGYGYLPYRYVEQYGAQTWIVG